MSGGSDLSPKTLLLRPFQMHQIKSMIKNHSFRQRCTWLWRALADATVLLIWSEAPTVWVQVFQDWSAPVAHLSPDHLGHITLLGLVVVWFWISLTQSMKIFVRPSTLLQTICVKYYVGEIVLLYVFMFLTKGNDNIMLAVVIWCFFSTFSGIVCRPSFVRVHQFFLLLWLPHISETNAKNVIDFWACSSTNVVYRLQQLTVEPIIMCNNDIYHVSLPSHYVWYIVSAMHTLQSHLLDISRDIHLIYIGTPCPVKV